MGELELADDVAGVGGDEAEGRDEEQARHEAEPGGGVGERENAQRDDLGDHEDGDVPAVW